LVQPDIKAAWYKIPYPTDKKVQCLVVGCIMPSYVSDGKRALCNQHLTEQAMQYEVVLRAAHSIPSHIEGGHCVFCGGTEWVLNKPVAVYQCPVCYPEKQYPPPDRPILSVSTFEAYPGDFPKMVAIRAEPISDAEHEATILMSEKTWGRRNSS
jgi:hypothetical protein